MTQKNIASFPMDNYYAKWVNYEPFENNSNNVVERFIGIGNVDNGTTNINKRLVNINNKITKDMIVKGISALLNSAITSVVKLNNVDIFNFVKIAAELNIKKPAVKREFKISDMVQKLGKAGNNFNKLPNFIMKFNNDLINKLHDIIDNQSKDIKDFNKANNMGSTIGSVIKLFSEMGNTAVDDAFNLGSVLVKSVMPCVNCTTSNKLILKNLSFIKSNLNLNDNFKVDINDKVNNIVSDALDKRYFAKCAETIKDSDMIDLSDSKIVLTDALISSITKCLFNQELLNNLVDKMIESINKLIDNASKSITDDTKNYLYAGSIGAATIFASLESLDKKSKPQTDNSEKKSKLQTESQTDSIEEPSEKKSTPKTNKYLSAPDKMNKMPEIHKTQPVEQTKIDSTQCPECVQKPCECMPIVCKECKACPINTKPNVCPACPECPDCEKLLKKATTQHNTNKESYETIIDTLYNYIYVLLVLIFIIGFVSF